MRYGKGRGKLGVGGLQTWGLRRWAVGQGVAEEIVVRLWTPWVPRLQLL